VVAPSAGGVAATGGATSEHPPASEQSPTPVADPGQAPQPSGGLSLPPPRVSALLVAVFLAFGVLLGNVASHGVNGTLASARSPLRVVIPSSGSSTSASTSSSSSESSASTTSEAPEVEPESTPAATKTSKTSTTPAKTQTTASETETGSGSPKGEGSSKSEAGAPAKKLPPIKHVFVIMLSDEPYASVFGPSSAAPYLTGKLEHEGELLTRYDAVAHNGLADEVALLSGQGPTLETAANCPNYTEIAPTGVAPDAQVLGSGCVYPVSVQTLAGQLSSRNLTWRAYVGGIDEGGAQGACAHPALGTADPTAAEASSSGPYATFRNPFVYFDSVLESPQCAADDVGLSKLKGDLASPASTPSFSYVVPDRCHDGNPTPCTAGAPSGLAPTNAFLKEVVPEITSSKAYKQSGLLVITVDEAPSSGAFADSSSCCGQPLFPNDPTKTLVGAPAGGGTVGALLLSPYIKGGTSSQEAFNHFSLLRTIEELFGVGHLGYAGLSSVKSFEPSMFTAGKG
jgi:hypothetical protein